MQFGNLTWTCDQILHYLTHWISIVNTELILLEFSISRATNPVILNVIQIILRLSDESQFFLSIKNS